MATKNQHKRITSPRGEALYPHLKTPEEYEGVPVGYTIQVRYSLEDTNKLKALLEEELKKAKESDDFKGKKWGKEPSLGYRENDNGDIIFKFRTKHEIKNKQGEIFKKTVPIFDSKGTPINVDIGNGSIVRVSFQVVPYHKAANNNGLTLRLEAIQVIDLVEYNGTQSADKYGFEEEEGYSIEDNTPPTDDETNNDGDF